MKQGESKTVVVVHGGAGGSRADDDGCVAAAREGLADMEKGALAAATAAVAALENDGRYNAGSGSVLCLDGTTIEMDAAVMDSSGKLGAVACIQRVRNPVLVARAVADTPHWLLAGEGAERFARIAGFAACYHVSERARRKHEALLGKLAGPDAVLPNVANAAFSHYWNYAAPHDFGTEDGCDTVGAVARDGAGGFAVACSTGGSAPSLLGRVGDTPIIGSGFYAGKLGAVAVTGIGEHIVRRLLAHTVYQWLAQGMPMNEALEAGVALFPREIDIGIIAVTCGESGARSNKDMPRAEAAA
jgi:beta-aspartyl-peptidase (threonine type)